MIEIQPWFERSFETSIDSGRFHGLFERLDGTSARIKSRFGNLPFAHLTNKPDGKWSVLENIGHLFDLEPLWFKRLEEITSSVEEMSEWDLTNKKTTEANHNDSGFEALLGSFSNARHKLMGRLRQLKDDDLEKRSVHPRLKLEMSVLDLMNFVAEHDDHHLAICRIMLRKF